MTPTRIPVEREWRFVDKGTWDRGPWDAEPDKVQWVDPATDLDCLAVRNPSMGFWCGYVGVPPGHRLHGVGYSACVATDCTNEWHSTCSPEGQLSVHGGLTFANACQEDDREQGICHIPAPGRPANVWWLGFDCGHSSDLAPGLVARERSWGWPKVPIDPLMADVYRTLEYVQAECASLARQLILA